MVPQLRHNNQNSGLHCGCKSRIIYIPENRNKKSLGSILAQPFKINGCQYNIETIVNRKCLSLFLEYGTVL